MMENHNKYTMKQANDILYPILGGDMSVLEHIDFPQDGRYKLLDKIDGWESLDDHEILNRIFFKEYIHSDVYIITDLSYSKDEVYFIKKEKINVFIDDYCKHNSRCFFNGATFFISPLNKTLLEFNDDGYVFLHKLPILLDDKGRELMLKYKGIIY
ncbi:hypothetical protein M5U04_04860 [Xenorhabdus sp. XENO-1]|uniref:hypothetical protein n=1 Tax=Xenorhabdus bovienii TaxID=40576 RepID=UPI0020CA5367|nr:hypothetical protein [Xenorhabdus bovienii]MCP9267440.1 hypothetical protein [Xenorhabdus bovienii subsp. africana]